ncbi:MAG: hypothetical protein NC318_02965 [Blautia sp.]|nr:hypothetical protein [Lachnoclostridium sp.]MCM1210543.1 hypothetical protein [Blautia sp.]
MNRKMIMVLHILCPIAIGALVYYLASPDVLFIQKAKTFIDVTDSAFLRLVRNYLADMMWGYSLVFALFYIIGNTTADLWKVLGIAFPFSAAMEMMQKTSFIPGTFDVFDIFVEFLAEIIAVSIIYKLYSREEI